MPIAFDTTGLQQQDPTTWLNPATGDVVGLQYFDLVPDLPAPLEDLPRLRHELAVLHGEAGCLIEAHTLLLGGLPALLRILKLPIPNQQNGQVFVASFTVPRAGSSAVLQIQAVERGTTGIREAVLADRVGFENWLMPHPYAPQSRGRLPFHAGDDPRYDPEFADHPLSRVRAWTHHVIRTVTVDPRFAALPPFQAPGAPQFPPPAHAPAPDTPSGRHAAPEVPPAPPTPQAASDGPSVPPAHAAPEARAPFDGPSGPSAHAAPEAQLPFDGSSADDGSAPAAHATPETPPGPAVGSTLTTVVPGIPIGGHLPLWIGEECTFWRMTNPDDVLALLGQGALARTPLTDDRFRDLVALDPDSSGIVLLNRYRSDDGGIAAGMAELTRVSGQEAGAALTEDTLTEAFRWVGQVSAAAAERGECVTVEPGTHEGGLQEPYVLMAVQEYQGQQLSVVRTAPAPPADLPMWEGRQALSGPATPETVVTGGLLAMYAMDRWGIHPLHMCLTFGPAPGPVNHTA